MLRRARALINEVHQKPHDVEALRAAQRALEDGGLRDDLANLLEWWAGYAPDDQLASRALLDAAGCYEDRPEKEAHALSLVMQALARDPSNEQAAFRMRHVLEGAHRVDELAVQLAEWSMAVRRDGGPATLCALASFTLAHLRARLDDTDGAIQALEDTLRAFPEHPDAKRTLAELYARRARTRLRNHESRAREDCHRAAQLYYELGVYGAGDPAVRDFLRALDLVPHHSAAMEAVLRRVGTTNLELVRKRLSGYVAFAPDRVRTHRLRFELVRYLFRERRYAESVPHLSLLSNRGYAEAARILERLCPDMPALLRRTAPELPAPPSYSDEHTSTDASRLRREDRYSSPPPSPEGPKDYELTAIVSGPDSPARPTLTVVPEPEEQTIIVDDFEEDDEDGRPTEVFPESVRDAVRSGSFASDAPAQTGERPIARATRARRLEQALGMAVVAVTSAVAVTSYVLGLGH